MSEVLKIVVRGRVQGVGFRYFVEKLARRMGVVGWVRNLPGGNVEVLARLEGSNRPLFLEALRTGPPASRVDRLEISPAPEERQCPASGFTIRF